MDAVAVDSYRAEDRKEERISGPDKSQNLSFLGLVTVRFQTVIHKRF